MVLGFPHGAEKQSQAWLDGRKPSFEGPKASGSKTASSGTNTRQPATIPQRFLCHSTQTLPLYVSLNEGSPLEETGNLFTKKDLLLRKFLKSSVLWAGAFVWDGCVGHFSK